jgi:thioredoxin
MKKIGYLLVLSVFMIASCSGTTGKNEDNSAKSTVTQTPDGGSTKSTATEGKLEHLTNQTFKKKVMDYEKNPHEWVFEGDKPVIVDFYASWCRPCRMIAPIMEELAEEYKGKIVIYKVDTDAEHELANVFGIQSLPTVLFIPMQGKPSMQKGAMDKESYKKIIDEFMLKKGTIK